MREVELRERGRKKERRGKGKEEVQEGRQGEMAEERVREKDTH